MSRDDLNSHPGSISIKDFIYDLPENRIAKYPLENRDTSKLLVYKNGGIEKKTFNQLSDLLQAKDCLVFNDTKVIHARVHFQRATGAHIEILCLEPTNPVEITEAFATTSIVEWKAMVGNGKRWKIGESLSRIITVSDESYQLSAKLIERNSDSYQIQFSWNSGKPFAQVLDEVGILPLPPYLNRDTEIADEERYQTVYAQADGSVAAPTAGLHFTKRVFESLREKKVETVFSTLHVGAGTFKPVKADTMQGHKMHQERIQVTRNTLEKLQSAANERRIIPVGTTSLRTIESLYWFGVKLLSGLEMDELFVGQWDPYELQSEKITPVQAINAVLDWLSEQKRDYLTGSTQLLIAPGYKIKLANALITNFHQPESTLLLLVAAFIGEDWRKVYDYALNTDFRFLSFGDSSILFRDSET